MKRMEGVHPLLVDWAFRVVSIMDCKVISGVRSLTEQRHMVSIGASKTMNSYHLVQDTGYGHALDLAPYPIDWNDLNRFFALYGVGLAVAHEMGIPVVWGGDWNSNGVFKDQTFNDLPHWQIARSQGPVMVSA